MAWLWRVSSLVDVLISCSNERNVHVANMADVIMSAMAWRRRSQRQAAAPCNDVPMSGGEENNIYNLGASKRNHGAGAVASVRIFSGSDRRG